MANPKKPPQIEAILRRNKTKLIAFLQNFHTEREGKQKRFSNRVAGPGTVQMGGADNVPSGSQLWLRVTDEQFNVCLALDLRVLLGCAELVTGRTRKRSSLRSCSRCESGPELSHVRLVPSGINSPSHLLFSFAFAFASRKYPPAGQASKAWVNPYILFLSFRHARFFCFDMLYTFGVTQDL